MRLTRIATAAGAALLIGGLGTSAYAAATLSTNVANASAASTPITVNFSGLSQADGVVFIQQCWIDGNAPGAVFNQASDCSQATGTNQTITASGSGSAVLNFFNGTEPNLEEWGCGPLTGSGVPKGTDGSQDACWVRLAPGVKTNTSTDEFYKVTFGTVAPPPDVPEVPLNVLLPASAAAVLGGAFLITRKRQTKAA